MTNGVRRHSSPHGISRPVNEITRLCGFFPGPAPHEEAFSCRSGMQGLAGRERPYAFEVGEGIRMVKFFDSRESLRSFCAVPRSTVRSCIALWRFCSTGTSLFRSNHADSCTSSLNLGIVLSGFFMIIRFLSVAMQLGPDKIQPYVFTPGNPPFPGTPGGSPAAGRKPRPYEGFVLVKEKEKRIKGSHSRTQRNPMRKYQSSGWYPPRNAARSALAS